jgi:hypothetical protein
MSFRSISNKTAAVRLVREAIKHASIKRDADGNLSLRGTADLDGAVSYLKVANFIRQGDSTIEAVKKTFDNLPTLQQVKLATVIDSEIQKEAAYVTPDKQQSTALHKQQEPVEQGNNLTTPQINQEPYAAPAHGAKGPVDRLVGAGAYGAKGGLLAGGALVAARLAGIKNVGRLARPAIVAGTALGGLYGLNKGHSNFTESADRRLGGLAEGTYQGVRHATGAGATVATLAGLNRLAGSRGLGKYILPAAALAGTYGFMRGHNAGEQKGYVGLTPVMGQRLTHPLKNISDSLDKQY